MHWRIATVAALALATLAAPAGAANLGSALRSPANVGFGCEASPQPDPITGAIVLTPTGQTTCTVRSNGFIGSLRGSSVVPSSGRITRIRVRSGNNPAPLRLTILGAASSLNLDGSQIPGTFSCCTARRFGRTFRPRPNAVTTRNVNVRVFSQIDAKNLSKTSDVVGLSAVGPGTLPLNNQGLAGSFQTGAALLSAFYPLTAKGDPRVEATSMTGFELLFQWRFRRR